MINFDAFAMARRQFNQTEFPFIKKQCLEMAEKKSFQGVKILHNIPLTMEAVLKVEPLLIGGADLTVSCMSTLEPHPDALAVLRSANVRVHIPHDFTQPYDICMDCGGELLDIVLPSIGTVELTKTGTDSYRVANTAYPVISVDDSSLKVLETGFGTGDGFVRALKQIGMGSFIHKRFVIFGYGKVGKGIATALSKVTNKIGIVDVDMNAVEAAIADGYRAVYGKKQKAVRAMLKKVDVVVTATGIPETMTNYYGFSKLNFGRALLTNMGAEDEYGDNFAANEVLFHKRPLNFVLDHPTATRYLDPIFYAHNLAANLLCSSKTKAGYHSLPSTISDSILETWCRLYGRRITDILPNSVQHSSQLAISADELLEAS